MGVKFIQLFSRLQDSHTTKDVVVTQQFCSCSVEVMAKRLIILLATGCSLHAREKPAEAQLMHIKQRLDGWMEFLNGIHLVVLFLNSFVDVFGLHTLTPCIPCKQLYVTHWYTPT